MNVLGTDNQPSAGQKIAVAMSGGVDSSVAAALLQRKGYDVFGLMMRLWSEPASGGSKQMNRCCTPDQMADARRVAELLDIPFYVIDAKEIFYKQVVTYYVNEHYSGRTPNPCIQCNQHIRFEYLLDYALSLGATHMATGHYARIAQAGNTRQLLVAKDDNKDQSYVLYSLDQKQLSRLLFPVGDYSKDEVRAMAADIGLPVADKSDSMDLCFLSDGNPVRFLKEYAPEKPQSGPILSYERELLGQHDGLPFYTIGQRKGLGIATGIPMHVIEKNAETNAIVVGTREQLGCRRLHAYQTNWISGIPLKEDEAVQVKIRYRAAPAAASIIKCNQDEVWIEFEQPVFGITPGQGAVFYKEGVCLGGGLIGEGN